METSESTAYGGQAGLRTLLKQAGPLLFLNSLTFDHQQHLIRFSPYSGHELPTTYASLIGACDFGRCLPFLQATSIRRSQNDKPFLLAGNTAN